MAAGERRGSSPAMDLAALALFFGAAAAAFFVPLFAGPTDMPGFTDTLFNMYVLEHVTRWLAGGVPSLASPGFYWPYPFTFAFSDTHLLSLPFYALPRWIGLSPESAFKVWFVAGYSLTFIAAHIAMRLMGLRPWPASLGAFAFVFSLPALAQILHAQLGWAAGVPFAFLFMLRYAGPQGRPSDLLAFTAAIALQIVLNIYLGFYALLLCAILFCCALAFDHGWKPRMWGSRLAGVYRDFRRPRGTGPGLAAFALLSVLCAVALLGFHGYVAVLYGFGRDWSDIAPMVPRWQSYLMMDALPYWEPISRRLPDVPARHEHQLFIGLPLGALFLLSFTGLARAPREKILLALTAPVALLLFLSVAGFSLYFLVAQLPGFNAIRAATRYELVALFPICVVAMLTLQGLSDRSRLGPVLMLAAAIWVISDVALFKRDEYDSSAERARIRQISADIVANGIGPRSVLAYGKGEPLDQRTHRQMLAMWAAMEAGVPTLNGYSGNYPPGGGNDNCSWFIHQLARYDIWARENGRPRLAELGYDIVPLRLPPCDLTPESVLARDAADLPASLLDRDGIVSP
ncbi:MAG: hypothetical protein AB7O39_00345 [Flavobacteriaceae bacterium]